MSAKNIRPTFGTKRPRVRIPTLRPNPDEILRFHPGFSLFSELISMENSGHLPFDPNAEKSGGIIRAGKDAAVKFSEWKGVEMARNVR